MIKKYLDLFIIMLAMLVLATISAYYLYTHWYKYTFSTSLQNQLNNTKLLNALEHSVLNELVCVVTMDNHKVLMKKICEPTKKTTDRVMQGILNQDFDTSLYILEKNIYEMRLTIEDKGMIAIEKLVNGDFDNKMNTFIQKYTTNFNTDTKQSHRKSLLNIYSDIAVISYETELEKALVSYYLTAKESIPASTLMYWDKKVRGSQLYQLDMRNISRYNEKVTNILNQDSFQEVLRKIEDIRIDIMRHASMGNYRTSVTKWIGLVNHKQKLLHNIESSLLDDIFLDVSNDVNKSKNIFIFALVALLLSLLGMLFSVKNWLNKVRKNTALEKSFYELSEMSRFETNRESNKTIDAVVDDDYIDIEAMQLPLVSEYTDDVTNTINSKYQNNLAFEVRTPLNGISGYLKLLKETPLNVEQSEFISLIENNYENLDLILNKAIHEPEEVNKKDEIKNISFDIVRKIESTVETFSIFADKKDIVLGLYIDPNILEHVNGDAVKLSQILTNLIDNSLLESSAYETINIRVEQIHSDSHQMNIKFMIQDQVLMKNSMKIDDIENLAISSNIIKRMGGTLEVEKSNTSGRNFFFTLIMEKFNDKKEVYPTFKDMEVGIALPSKDISRPIDSYLEIYIKHLNANVTIYDYETLFNSSNDTFPDVLFVYHNYARLEGELESFIDLPCRVALITSGTLRSRIDTDKYTFSSILYAPMTMRKVLKVFTESKIDKQILHNDTIESINDNSLEKFNNIKALVVEDNMISQRIISKMLENYGVVVDVASNGQDGLTLRKEKDFDIIFMDIEMPVMNGFELTSKILYYEGINQFEHVPIIALTANKYNDEKNDYEKAGLDDFMVKPVDVKTLHAVVQKFCVDLPKQMAESEEDALIAKVLSGDFLKE